MAETVITNNQWKGYVKRLLKAELEKNGVNYQELAKRLAQIGLDEKPENINTKINRGTFRASFLIQCLKACGCRDLNIEI